MSQFPLVSTQWLKGKLDDPSVVILDATYHLPAVKRDAKAEFESERIPGARIFDIDAIKDPSNPLPHMIPTPEIFAGAVRALGIDNNTHVVCYDTYGLFSAARPWWMFRLYGHDKVSVLDGGMVAWKAAGLATESGPLIAPELAMFEARFRPELLRKIDQVRHNIDAKKNVVLDARAAGRYNGTVPEPRPELRSGHIPGALNLPFDRLFDPNTKRMQDARALGAMFHNAGVKVGSDTVVASCGSGVTACVLALGLHLLGDETAAVYDGSWSEWGGRADTPIENPSAD